METSSRVRLMGNLQSAVAEAVSGTMDERGRGMGGAQGVYRAGKADAHGH